MLQNPEFAKIVSIPQSYQHIMEGLFIHFFPDTNDSTVVYTKEDVGFYLSFSNEQSKWKVHVQTISQNHQSENLISSSKFKFHLDRILCKGWSDNATNANPLTFYKSEVHNKPIT